MKLIDVVKERIKYLSLKKKMDALSHLEYDLKDLIHEYWIKDCINESEG